MKVLILILISIIYSHDAFCQTTDDDVLYYYEKVPQEKLFVHTDKDYYVAGDTVWFRVHVADAATNKAVSRSKYVYLELHDNSDGTLVNRIKIKADSDSVFANMIPLDYNLPASNYTLYAYTQWMTNFDYDLFFKKQIHIVDSTFADAVNLKELPVRHLSLFVMPEGGNLIAGKNQRVAYKVIDDDEHGVDVRVRLKNKHGETLQESLSQHIGMGSIFVNAMPEDSLFIEAEDLNGNTCRTNIPQPLEYGATIQVIQHNGMMNIEIIHTENINLDDLSIVLYGAGNLLTIQMREQKSNVVRLDSEILHPGIVNIALLDKNKNQVLAERLAYIEQPLPVLKYKKNEDKR